VQKWPEVGGAMWVACERTWQGDIEWDEGGGLSKLSKRTLTVRKRWTHRQKTGTHWDTARKK